jgi:hypothetical protein
MFGMESVPVAELPLGVGLLTGSPIVGMSGMSPAVVESCPLLEPPCPALPGCSESLD